LILYDPGENFDDLIDGLGGDHQASDGRGVQVVLGGGPLQRRRGA
jgi:hypothetical protein